MGGLLKFSMLVLSLIGFAASFPRQRRFLLNTMEGAKDITPRVGKDFPFAWEFGDGNFSLTNRDGVIMALSDASDVAYAMMRLNLILYSDASNFRSIVIRLSDSTPTRLDKWKAAADVVTAIRDASETVQDITLHYMAEIITEMGNLTNSRYLKGLVDTALRNSGIAIVRVDNLLNEGWTVLTSLRDAEAKNIYIDDLNSILAQFLHLEDLTTKLASTYRRFITAAGIEPDD